MREGEKAFLPLIRSSLVFVARSVAAAVPFTFHIVPLGRSISAGDRKERGENLKQGGFASHRDREKKRSNLRLDF